MTWTTARHHKWFCRLPSNSHKVHLPGLRRRSSDFCLKMAWGAWLLVIVCTTFFAFSMELLKNSSSPMRSSTRSSA